MIRRLELEAEAEYHRGGSFRYITSSPPFFASRALEIDFGQHVRLGLVWSDVWSVVEDTSPPGVSSCISANNGGLVSRVSALSPLVSSVTSQPQDVLKAFRQS